MDSPHKGPMTRKMSPFDDVIMCKMINIYDCAHHHLSYGNEHIWVWGGDYYFLRSVIFPFFKWIKPLVTYWIPRSYLTGVTAAALWRQQSNMNVIQMISLNRGKKKINPTEKLTSGASVTFCKGIYVKESCSPFNGNILDFVSRSDWK